MIRSKLIFSCAVLLMLTAGVVVGRLSVLVPAAEPAASQPSSPQRGWLEDQLQLTPDQKHQMDAIWADTRQKMDRAFEARHSAEKARDQAIRDLLSADQQKAYDKIMDDFRTARADMEKQRGQLMHDAEERSRALLDDDQKKIWDAMNKHDHGEGRGMHHPSTDRSGPGMPGPDGPGADRGPDHGPGPDHDDHP